MDEAAIVLALTAAAACCLLLLDDIDDSDDTSSNDSDDSSEIYPLDDDNSNDSYDSNESEKPKNKRICVRDSIDRRNQNNDSCTNSFISGVTSMPSYLDAEGSLDGLDDDDLELTKNLRGVTPSNYSSDSSDNEHKDIKFESSHFNRDSSSSDEEHNYEQGLAFSELDTVDSKQQKSNVSFTQQLSSDILSNLGTMGTSFVSKVLKTAASATTTTPAKITKRSDSDSDFEIINPDDIQTDET